MLVGYVKWTPQLTLGNLLRGVVLQLMCHQLAAFRLRSLFFQSHTIGQLIIVIDIYQV